MSDRRKRSPSIEDHRRPDSTHRRDRRDRDRENKRDRDRRDRIYDNEDHDRRQRYRNPKVDHSDDEDRDLESSRRSEGRHKHRPRSRDDPRRRHRSRSPDPKRRRRSHSRSRSPPRKSRAPLPSQNDSYRNDKRPANGEAPSPPPKETPNFKPTGLLAKEANTIAGTTTVLKYHEPPEARKPPPKDQWRMYVFKGKDLLETIHLYQRSCWLFGRERTVADCVLEHPSISKQHAVVQFRYISSANEFGDRTGRVKPYLIDLESANGTRVNAERVEASRYLELRDGDVLGFGDSEREYVLMLPAP